MFRMNLWVVGLEMSFRLVKSGHGKPEALLDTLRQLRPDSAAMVFTNTTKAAVFVTAMLREQVTAVLPMLLH